jgi:hypothetical protein
MVAYPNQAEPAGDDTSDEQMLENVRMGMGNQEGPPPGSSMKWQNLQDDQSALEADPSPENVQAFVQYWGQENLPPDLQQQAQGPPQGAPPQGAPPMPPGR